MGKSQQTHGRPTFYFENNRNQPIRAVGLLLMCYHNGSPYFMLCRYHDSDPTRSWWADLGGKTDKVDKTYIDTACREATEETNHLFATSQNPSPAQSSFNWFKSLIKNAKISSPHYIRRSKYLYFTVKIKPSYMLKSPDFGPIEIHNNYPRDIQWFTHAEFLEIINQNQSHPRLDRNTLITLLTTHPQYKPKKSPTIPTSVTIPPLAPPHNPKQLPISSSSCQTCGQRHSIFNIINSKVYNHQLTPCPLTAPEKPPLQPSYYRKILEEDLPLKVGALTIVD